MLLLLCIGTAVCSLCVNDNVVAVVGNLWFGGGGGGGVDYVYFVSYRIRLCRRHFISRLRLDKSML